MCHLFAHQPQRDYESQTRSLRIGGHCTSIRLETAFWDTLEEIAAREMSNRVAACTLALSPIRDTLIEGFSHFVTP